jgi:glycosyltransferase involved in cell wall biosynthesis
MNIVLPVHHFPPRYSAGAELYTFRLARWLQEHGHQVEVVCVEAIDRHESGELQAIKDRYEGTVVWRLAFDMARGADFRWTYDNPLLNEWFTSYFRRHRPDIVHSQAGYLIGATPIITACAAGIPTALTLHDYWFLCPRITLQRGDGSLCETIPDDPAGCAWCMRLESRRYRLPEKLSAGLAGRVAQAISLGSGRREIADRRARLFAALGLPDVVIAPSRFMAETFAPFIAPERLRIAGLGLDLAPFIGLRRAAPDGTLRIGFTGQIAPHKGVHLLIEAFRKLQLRGQPIKLHIYGGLESHPDYVARLRKLAAGDQRIQFQGRFENMRAAEILGQLSVAVVPSIWYENSPLAILEAHAAGTPVVTAALGGMAELVRDGVDGLHFAPASAADLARQLQRLIDEPELLALLRGGVRMPRSIDDEMRQIGVIYNQLAAHPGLEPAVAVDVV